jgi:ribose transport system ATP-binding protein
MQRKPEQKPYLTLKGISKSFGITKALSDVDLDLYTGEVIGLVGPNGAGKSTLMKILTGILPPTGGSIFVNGQEITKYTAKEAKELGISCAYQDLSLCTNLTVYENFALLNMPHNPLTKPGWRRAKQEETKNLWNVIFRGAASMS